MLSIFLFPSSSREPYSKTVAHIIPRLQWDYKRKTEETNQFRRDNRQTQRRKQANSARQAKAAVILPKQPLADSYCKDILRG